MILRELLAVFGIAYDKDGQEQAERGINSLKKTYSTFQQVVDTSLRVFAAAGPFVFLAKMASEVQEQINLMNITFEGNAETIEAWAQKTGPAIGRSRDTLRGLATQFGALLRPAIGVGDQLTEMSTRLTQVAVDLSSVRDISEKESLTVLQSAMAGETEAIKRFGVDMRVARMEAEAMRMGMNKTYRDMTQAEQAQLRYNIILKDLAFIAGDAENTQFSFANSVRALRDQLKDIGTSLGFFLIPAFEDLLRWVRTLLKPVQEMADAFMLWNKETNLALGVLATLGGVIASIVIPPLLGILAAVIPLILAFGAYALVIDEVITTFQGGDSIIKRFTDWLDGLEARFNTLNPIAGAAVVVFNRFRDVLGAVGLLVASLIESLIQWDLGPLTRAMDALVSSFVNWVKPLKDIASWIHEIVTSDFWNLLKENMPDWMKNLVASAPSYDELKEATSLVGGPGLIPALSGLSGSPTRGVTVVNEGSRTNNMQITQLPGESGEELAKRIDERISQKEDEKSQAILAALAPEPGG